MESVAVCSFQFDGFFLTCSSTRGQAPPKQRGQSASLYEKKIYYFGGVVTPTDYSNDLYIFDTGVYLSSAFAFFFFVSRLRCPLARYLRMDEAQYST
jgi:hypothetical protein